MTDRPYRLTTIVQPAQHDAPPVEEAVAITADHDDAAIDLAQSYIETFLAETIHSASLIDMSGKVIWRKGEWNRGNNEFGMPQPLRYPT